jgi:hypothetical protein
LLDHERTNKPHLVAFRKRVVAWRKPLADGARPAPQRHGIDALGRPHQRTTLDDRVGSAAKFLADEAEAHQRFHLRGLENGLKDVWEGRLVEHVAR